jgi:RNA polymerase sigma-70 factor (ECF subfamily)
VTEIFSARFRAWLPRHPREAFAHLPSDPSYIDSVALAQRAAADARARDQIVARLRPRVRRIAKALLRHADDAEDAEQVALVEVLTAAPTYRGESSLEAWADRIAVRTAIRMARERRLATVRLEAELSPDDLHGPPAPSPLSESIPRPIRAYLDQLPEARRTALVLRHALGHSIEEIAELTAVSVNTVKDRLLHAREQVRRMVRRDVATGARCRCGDGEGER